MAAIIFASKCECQSAKSHYYAVAVKCALLHAPVMEEWSSEWARAAIRRFMKARRLKVSPWADDAGIARSTLRNFLKGGPEAAITLKTLDLLAAAAGVNVAVLLGLAPDLTKDQLRAAEIAGCLSPDDLNVWLHWGAKNLPPPVDQGQPPAVAERRRR